MWGIGWQELLIIFAIALLLFGAKRLPEIARSMGEGVREFRRAARSFMDEDDASDSSGDHALPSTASTQPRQVTSVERMASDPAGPDAGDRN